MMPSLLKCLFTDHETIVTTLVVLGVILSIAAVGLFVLYKRNRSFFDKWVNVLGRRHEPYR